MQKQKQTKIKSKTKNRWMSFFIAQPVSVALWLFAKVNSAKTPHFHYKYPNVIKAGTEAFWKFESFEFLSSSWEGTKDLNTVTHSSQGFNQRMTARLTKSWWKPERPSPTLVIIWWSIYSKPLAPDHAMCSCSPYIWICFCNYLVAFKK